MGKNLYACTYYKDKELKTPPPVLQSTISNFGRGINLKPTKRDQLKYIITYYETILIKHEPGTYIMLQLFIS